MFQRLVHDTASQLDLPVGGVASLLRSILTLLAHEQHGLDGFLDLFRRVGLSSAIDPWNRGKTALGVTGPQLETALGPTLLEKFGTSSGLSRTAVLSALTLLLPQVIGRLRADGLDALQPRDGKPPAMLTEATHATTTAWTWIPWLAVAILILAAVAWVPGPWSLSAAQLTLRNENGRIVYSGTVPDINARAAIITALRDRFGETRLQGGLLVDAHVNRPDWLSHVNALVATLQTPGAELALQGSSVGIGGWLSTADAHALRVNVQRILGTTARVAPLGDLAAATARAANDKAVSALVAVGTSGISTDRLVETMSSAIINFKTGSADVPPEAMLVIRKSAEAIARAPSDTTIEIAGHTDNTGDPVANVTLSQARADAVKAALIAAGAPGARLIARGYGDTQPRASNDTEYGRFRNRRIEYRVVSGGSP